MGTRRDADAERLADPNLPPFHRLALTAKRDRGLTYREIERLGGRRPDGRPYILSRVAQRMMTTPMDGAPSENSIIGLSAALNIPERQLREAISITLGLSPDSMPTGSGTLAHAYADRINLLDPEERKHILGTMRRLIEAAEALEYAAARDAADATGSGGGHAERNGVSGGGGAGE